MENSICNKLPINIVGRKKHNKNSSQNLKNIYNYFFCQHIFRNILKFDINGSQKKIKK